MEDDNDAVLREMTEQSDQIFFIYNPRKKRFTYVNTAFEQITRKNSRQLYDDPLPLLDMVHPEDRAYVKDNFDSFGSRKTSTLLDFRIIRSDNVERWLQLKVYPILNKGEVQHITGIAEDESATKATIANMEKVNGWKDAALEIIAHDLRGPIGIISMLTAAITKNLPDNENKQCREWLQMIDKISKRNLDLIRDLLTQGSLDTERTETCIGRCDLVWEISEVMHIFTRAQHAISKTFQFTHSHDHIYAEIDSMKFMQIINNLVSNAIKFTPDNGFIKVHLEKLNKSAVITVQDDGIGIPRHLHPYLFTKRTAAGRTGLNGEESVGLGMWIVNAVTQAHGGRVWFESEQNKGSKFYVELPLDGRQKVQ